MNHRIFLSGCIFFVFISCSTHEHNPDGHTSTAAQTEMSEEHPEDEVHLTKEQAQNIGVSYSRISGKSLQSDVKLTGRVELPPDGKAIASSPLNGIVNKINISEGQFVTEGQTLFTISNLDLIDWSEQFQSLQAELSFLDKEIERQQFLSDEKIAPVKTLQSLQSDREKTVIKINAIEKRMAFIGLSKDRFDEVDGNFVVTAPQSGYIQHIEVHKGSHVGLETRLVEIINDSHLRIHLYAYANEIDFLEKGQTIDFFVHTRPESIRKANIIWINNLVNEENNSYEIHADIVGELKSLSPGEFVEARVINKEEILPSLPEQSLTNDKGLSYIFIVEEDHGEEIHFKKIQVRTGVEDMGWVEIVPIDVIPDSALVVTAGSFFLMAESKKGEGGGGHHH